ncbi:hypothetical protein HN873_019522, partial [Arachis hypogaea]
KVLLEFIVVCIHSFVCIHSLHPFLLMWQCVEERKKEAMAISILKAAIIPHSQPLLHSSISGGIDETAKKKKKLLLPCSSSSSSELNPTIRSEVSFSVGFCLLPHPDKISYVLSSVNIHLGIHIAYPMHHCSKHFTDMGISTYDYIIALTDQEQEQQGAGGQQSPQMSTVSSLTGFSSVSSFTMFQHGSWCTPPCLFDEDQFDVIPPENDSVSSLGKKSTREEPSKRKNPGAFKISPWTLARLNTEEVSKVAAEARKRSKILKPVVRHNDAFILEPKSSFGSRGRQVLRIDNKRRAASKQGFLPADIAMASMTNVFANNNGKGFSGVSSLAPLQLEPCSAFDMSKAMSSSAANIVASSDLLLEGRDLP